MRYCKWCGQHLVRQGRSTSELQFCENCQAPLQAVWVFCKTCGARVNAEPKQRLNLTCSQCGAINKPESKFCLECGAPLEQSRPDAGSAGSKTLPVHCQQCGVKLEPGASFCKACGASISGPVTTTDVKSLDTSSLLCISCHSRSPMGSTRCVVCGASLIDFVRPESGRATVRDFARPPETVKDLSGAAELIDPQSQAGDETLPAGAETNDAMHKDASVKSGGESVDPKLDSNTTRVPEGRPSLGGAHGFDTNVLASTEVIRQTSAIGGKTTGPVEQEAELESRHEFERLSDVKSGPSGVPTGGAVKPRQESTLDLVSVSTPVQPPSPIESAPRELKEKPEQKTVEAAAPAAVVRPAAGNSVASGSKRIVVVGLVALIVVLLGAGGFLAWRLYEKHRNESKAISVTPNGVTETTTNDKESGSGSEAKSPDVENPAGMVLVAAGTYRIGRDDGDPLARPAHSVQLEAFYIDKTEVTNREYKRFADASGHGVPPVWKSGSYPAGEDDWPVCNVSWQDASDYAAWAGKRLPTEAEWEAAARGRDGLVYPWGNEWKEGVANIGKKSTDNGIEEVGRYKAGASPVGALDMIGNVWEWTADGFKLYPDSKEPAPAVTDPAAYRIIRGGAFDGKRFNDASYRGYLRADKGYDKTGFRCVKSAASLK